MQKPAWKTPDPRWLIPLAVACLAVLVFAQVAGHDFVNYDDTTYLTSNPHLNDGLSFSTIFWAFTTTYANFWHPLTWISHLLDVKLFGMNPSGHHLHNLLLHVINSILLYLLLNRMTGAVWRSAVVAALFAIHPMHVESVAWASERKDTLSTLFWLLTSIAYVWYAQKPVAERYLLVIVFFVMGLMAKPMLVVLPFTLLLFDFWPLQRITRAPALGKEGKVSRTFSLQRALFEKLPLFVLAAVFSIVAYTAQASGGAIGSLETYSLPTRLGNALTAYFSYVVKFFWPHAMSVHYPYPDQFSLPDMLVAVSCLLVITVIVFRFKNSKPYLLTGWLWFLGTLVPVIGLVQLGSHAMADRYTYVSYIGLFILVTWLTYDLTNRLSNKGTVRSLLAIVVITGLAWKAHSQVAVWQNTETLFNHALSVTSDNIKANNNLGTYYLSEDNLEKAEAYFKTALKISSENATVNYNMGVVLKRQGRYQEAAQYFTRSIETSPEVFVANRDMADVLQKLARPEEAIKYLKRAVELNDQDLASHINLANLLLATGNIEEAIKYYNKSLDIAPESYLGYYNLGRAYAEKMDFGRAMTAYAESLRFNPYNVRAHNNLGNILAQVGFVAEAIAHYNEAIRIDPEFTEAHRNKAIVLKKQQL